MRVMKYTFKGGSTYNPLRYLLDLDDMYIQYISTYIVYNIVL